MDTREVTALIEELKTASQAYYHEFEESPLTDEEFDAKLDHLATLADTYPALFATGTQGFLLLEGDPSLGTAPTADDIILHAVPMLSLAKAKTEDELHSFTRKIREAGASDFRIQAKLDGFALAAEYENGALVRISTRGDGVRGENITYLHNNPRVTTLGLPASIPDTHTLEVRGELYLSDVQFQALDQARAAVAKGERFKNSRNGLVGTIKKAKGGLPYDAEVSFAAYSVIDTATGAHLSMDAIDTLGFTTVDAVTEAQVSGLKLTGFTNDDELFDSIHAFGALRPGFTIPTDGAVIKPVEEAALHAAMGNTSHHPASQIAFKYPGEKGTSTIRAIEITVGKTGKLNPTAKIDPVELADVTITSVSLHNFNWMAERDIRIGSTVTVTRANDVIPYVEALISNPVDSTPFVVPTACPVCGSEAKGTDGLVPSKTIKCTNIACSSRADYALKTAVGKDYLDIDGMSDKLLTFLIDSGRVATLADLYTLTQDELENASFGTTAAGGSVKLGEKRAAHILHHIELSKATPIHKMLAALAIDGLGRSMSKLMVKRFKDLDGIRKATSLEIIDLDKMGPVRAASIVAGLEHKADLIDALLAAGVEFVVEDKGGSTSLAGLSFAISGAVPAPFANRNAWVDFVEANGGEFHSGPKATTSFMVGDATEGSSKVKKAVTLGLAFITPEEFTARFTS